MSLPTADDILTNNNLDILNEEINNCINQEQYQEQEQQQEHLPTVSDDEDKETNLVTIQQTLDSNNTNPHHEQQQSQNMKQPDNIVAVFEYQNKLLSESLNERNKELDIYEKENLELKDKIVKYESDLINKDNIISQLQTSNTKYKTQNLFLISENESLNTANKDLNAKITELNNQLLTYTYMSTNPNISKYIMNSTNTNANKELELEIQNSKLQFELNTLKTKIDSISIDNQNEKEILEELHSKTIDNLNKHISSLQKQIKYLNETVLMYNQNKLNDEMSIQSQTQIFSEINTLQNKLRSLEDEKHNLEQMLSKEQNENSRYKMVLQGKEKIITSLNEDRENYENTTKQLQEQLQQMFVEYKNKEQEIEKIINEKNALINELNNITEQLKQKDIITNDMKQSLLNFKGVYETVSKKNESKIKEYKQKIQTLKMKIKELHNEIDNYKEKEKRNFEYLRDTLDNMNLHKSHNNEMNIAGGNFNKNNNNYFNTLEGKMMSIEDLGDSKE